MNEQMTCDEVSEALPELALSVLPADEDEAVIDHLRACRRCGDEARLLVDTAEALFSLLPREDPPPGFERRLLARRGRTAGLSPPQRRKPVRLLAAAAGTLALLGAGSAIGVLAARTPRGASHAAALDSAYGRAVGEVLFTTGRRPALLVTVSAGDWTGWVRCVVSFGDGRSDTVGRFDLRSGPEVWAAALPRRDVTAVRLLEGDGATLARARFA